MWCMTSKEVTLNPALEWLLSQPNMSGVSHDGMNQVYTHVPPAELLAGVEEKLLYDTVLAETNPDAALLKMIAQAAVFMESTTSNVLTGEKRQFVAMFATPHHRIWCAKYDDNVDGFESDYLLVFGQTPTELTTPEQASAMIRQYFAGQ